jgi:hypothetical protein
MMRTPAASRAAYAYAPASSLVYAAILYGSAPPSLQHASSPTHPNATRRPQHEPRTLTKRLASYLNLNR